MVSLVIDDVAPFADWAAAARRTLAVLHSTLGLDVWMVTHIEDDRQVVLFAHPQDLVPVRTTVPWDRSFCRKMLSGAGPRVSTVTAATPAYAALLIDRPERVAAYLGVPLVTRTGTVFGTLCGVSARAQPRSFTRNLPLVELLARMLSTLLPEDGATDDSLTSPLPGGPGRVGS